MATIRLGRNVLSAIEDGLRSCDEFLKVGGQAVLGRQGWTTTPWPTERHGYDPT